MDDRRFDDLTRRFAAGTSRRSLLKWLAGSVAGAAVAGRASEIIAQGATGDDCTTDDDCGSELVCLPETSQCFPACYSAGFDCGESSALTCCDRCCSRACSDDGLCLTCVPEGVACNLAASPGCCEGLECTGGECAVAQACGGGPTCSDVNDCDEDFDQCVNGCCQFLTPCVGLGFGCSFASDCCDAEATCPAGTCCSPEGVACTQSSDCCVSGQVCSSSGTCQECASLGVVCADSVDCCSGTCDPVRDVCCNTVDLACTGDGDCCGNSTCDGDVCVAEVSCIQDGGDCELDADCCPGGEGFSAQCRENTCVVCVLSDAIGVCPAAEPREPVCCDDDARYIPQECTCRIQCVPEGGEGCEDDLDCCPAGDEAFGSLCVNGTCISCLFPGHDVCFEGDPAPCCDPFDTYDPETCECDFEGESCIEVGAACSETDPCCDSDVTALAGYCDPNDTCEYCIRTDAALEECGSLISSIEPCCDPAAVFNVETCSCEVECADISGSCAEDEDCCPVEESGLKTRCESGTCGVCFETGVQLVCTGGEQGENLCCDPDAVFDPARCICELACEGLSGPCEDYDDCCPSQDEGIVFYCNEGTCDYCIETGVAIICVAGGGDSEPCCDPEAIFDSETCMCEIPCYEKGSSCYDDWDCCDPYQCVDGTCGVHDSCVKRGETCDEETHCCKGYACKGGVCKRHRKPEKPHHPGKPESPQVGGETVHTLPSTGSGGSQPDIGVAEAALAGGVGLAAAAWLLKREKVEAEEN